VTQRHEQPDLELVGVHEPRDDVAARNLLAGAAHAIGHDTVERRRDARPHELLVRLREQRLRDVEIGRGQIAIRLRLVDGEPRHRSARRAQPIELALERLQVHGGAIDTCRLFGPSERQLAHVEPGDDLSRGHRRARFCDPLQTSGDGGGQVRGVARAHETGRVHRGRELPDLGLGRLHRGRALLLRLVQRAAHTKRRTGHCRCGAGTWSKCGLSLMSRTPGNRRHG
jgi:hypothetical protein